jgi:hypothetical protein
MAALLPLQILGGLGMLDDGSDWKIIAARVGSPLAAEVDGVWRRAAVGPHGLHALSLLQTSLT